MSAEKDKEMEFRVALAQQHKNTRYDAIEEVEKTQHFFQQRQDEGKLSFEEINREMDALKQRIMNLRRKKN